LMDIASQNELACVCFVDLFRNCVLPIVTLKTV
jgi:hypothetical protein